MVGHIARRDGLVSGARPLSGRRDDSGLGLDGAPSATSLRTLPKLHPARPDGARHARGGIRPPLIRQCALSIPKIELSYSSFVERAGA